VLAYTRGRGVGSELPRAASAPDRILLRRGRRGAPSIFLGSRARRLDFGGAGVALFWPLGPINTPPAFWERFWGCRLRCSKIPSSRARQTKFSSGAGCFFVWRIRSKPIAGGRAGAPATPKNAAGHPSRQKYHFPPNRPSHLTTHLPPDRHRAVVPRRRAASLHHSPAEHVSSTNSPH
jgi:hypothetical protein